MCTKAAVALAFPLWNDRFANYTYVLYRYWWNTRILPLTKKIISSSRAVKILFLSFTCEDIGVAIVTNRINQLQESFPLRRAAGSFEISLVQMK